MTEMVSLLWRGLASFIKQGEKGVVCREDTARGLKIRVEAD